MLTQNKVHIKFHSTEGQHTKVTVFMRGANCGTLVFRSEEAIWFNHILAKGCEQLGLCFVASGPGPIASDKAIDLCAIDLSGSKEKEKQ